MANQQTFEFIKQQLVDEWNLFRQEHPDEAIDLSGADLSHDPSPEGRRACS